MIYILLELIKMYLNSDSRKDKHYSYPQFTKSDGNHDMLRTTYTNKKTQ